MKFIYKDILRFLDDKPSKDSLSEKLFQLGHEHEVKNDIYDMELTPNRGDCLSLNGIARDLNIFYSHSNNLEIFEDDIQKLDINLKNLSVDDCPKISFLEIEISNPTTKYESSIENYFEKLNINKTNFFVDIANYLSYELGQPLHCYDREKVSLDLTFKKEKCDEDFDTLLDSTIRLTGANCVFLDKDKIINLAGIMGGKSSSCDKTTRKSLIECAYFNPESIMGKSVKYNLVSDAAYKFERGVDRSMQEFALRRFINIVSKHANIKSLRLKSYDFAKYQKRIIKTDEIAVGKILGTSVKRDNFLDSLNKLGFKAKNQIEVPPHRHDVMSENDIAEEIARIIGYENIQAHSFTTPSITTTSNFQKIELIRDLMVKKGFTEVINYPFSSEKEDKSISIDNPLDVNKRYLRKSLKDSLIENLLYNERRQNNSIKLFEISDIYHDSKNYENSQYLALIAAGRIGNNYRDFSQKINKKYLHDLFENILKKDQIQISSIPRENLNSKSKDNIFFLELNIGDIDHNLVEYETPEITREFFSTRFDEISEFPSSTRDFSFSITNISSYNKVIELIECFNHPDLKDSFIFDFYLDHKSLSIKLGVRMIFQSNKKTLSEEQIVVNYQKLLSPILDLDGVTIPGMQK